MHSIETMKAAYDKPLSLKTPTVNKYLTAQRNMHYADWTPAKSGVGRRNPFYFSGAQVASFAVKRLFLCVYHLVMVGRSGSIRAGRSLSAVFLPRSTHHLKSVGTLCVMVKTTVTQETAHV